MVGLARLLARLADGPGGAAQNARAVLRVWACELGYRKLGTWPTLQVGAGGQRFEIAVGNLSELHVVREVFVDRQYEIETGEPPEAVLDLGSNVGASIVFFRSRYPDARIIGLEPDPAAFERLQVTVGALANVEVYPWAVADSSGRRVLYQSRQSWESTLVPHGDTATTAVEVEARSMADLRVQLGLESVDFLKLDVEGAEWLMLHTLTGCRTIVGELHFDGPGETIEVARDALAAYEVTVTERMEARANFVARLR